MINVLIIDDEKPARDLIRNYLDGQPEIEIAGECEDGFTGVKMISEFRPDIIFLDIQMPRLTGFEMLDLLEKKPVTVFTTAYDQYAIKAFELNGCDYLLKPFGKERFQQALNKAIRRVKENENLSNEQKIIHTLDKGNELLSRVAVRSGSKIQVIATNDIQFLEADGDYVMIHTRDGRFLKEKTMKYFESHLDPQKFIRIHRSFIVNVDEMLRIEQYDKDNHILVLRNSNKLKVSAAGYKLLRKKLKM